MRPEILIFDVDDTLYPPSTGLWDYIGTRIDDFIYDELRLPREEIPTLRRNLYNQYGTTMRGLRILYNIDPGKYLDYVHDVPLEQFLQPNPGLKTALQRVPIRKWIFTNADSNHARRVANFLGVEDCFERIVDILDISPYCKPMPEAYLKALEIMQVSDPSQVVLFEDTRKNILTARELGIYTIQVGGSADHIANDQIHSMEDIPTLFKADFSVRQRKDV